MVLNAQVIRNGKKRAVDDKYQRYTNSNGGSGAEKKPFHYWCNCLNYCNFTILAIIVILPILVITAIIVIIAFQMNGDFAVDTGEVKEAR